MVHRNVPSGSFHGHRGALVLSFVLLALFLIAADALSIPSFKTTPATFSFVERRSGQRRHRGSTFLAEANSNGAESTSCDPDSNGDTENEAQAMKDMETLIVSLSTESDDTTRRARVAALFDEKLKHGVNANGDDEMSFENLFNRVLVVVGDQVRFQASSLSSSTGGRTVQPNSTNDVVSTEITEELPQFPLPSQQKSETELQLWALVDMMVQSKTLIRKAAGRLGIDGQFG